MVPSNNSELSAYAINVIDQRLEGYYANPDDVEDFNEMLKEIEMSI